MHPTDDLSAREIEDEVFQLIWSGRAAETADKPPLLSSSWAAGVQADMVLAHRNGPALPQLDAAAPPYCGACMVMMARDESDFIEANLVWHYAAGFRRMLILDNNSRDHSLEILFGLRARLPGAELVIVSDPVDLYIQAEKTSGLVALAAGLWPDCGWIFPIDADELLVPSRGLGVLADIAADAIVVSKTNHFLNEPRQQADAVRVFEAMPHRTGLGRMPPKIGLRARPDLRVSMGNHNVVAPPGTPVSHAGGLQHGIYMREFQIRSFGQFRRKVVDGAKATWAAEAKLGRRLGCDHWKFWYKLLEEHGEDALQQAFRNEFVRPASIELIEDVFRIPPLPAA